MIGLRKGAICALTWALALFAGTSGGVSLDPDTAAYERLEQDLQGLYDQANALSRTPAGANTRGDVAGAVDNCRYLDQFQSLEVFAYERIEEDRQRCAEQVATRYPEHPEVLLYQLEAMSGQALIGDAHAILERGQAVGWTNAQAARLYELLAYAYAEQDMDRAGYYANAAIDLDLFSPARRLAVQWLVDRGRLDDAKRLLQAPRPEGPRDLVGEIPLLFQLGADEQALERYEQLQAGSNPYYDRLALARVLLNFGRTELAKAEYDSAVSGDWFNDYKARILYERLRVALANGDREDAVASYDALRADSWEHDPVLRSRLMLARAYPDLPWSWRELPGGLLLLGGVLGALILPLLVLIGPVHYRGLARRQAGKPHRDSPFPWRLEHAWFAVGLALVLNLAAAYAFDPISWGPGLPTSGDSPVADADGERAIANMTVAALIANGLVALALLPAAGGSAGLRRLGASAWDWRRTLTVVLLAWLGLRILAALLLTTFSPQVTAVLAQIGEVQTELHSTIEAIGLWPSVILMGFVAPLSEELLFRGVLLSAFARHLSFTVANLLQATLFALIHGELLLSPFFLAMGLVAGWTVKGSGGLRAAILLHILNNIVAVALRVGLSSLGGDG